MCELLLGQAEEEVGLVLGEVGGALENPAVSLGVVFVDRVVTSGDAVGADGAGGLEELVELEVVVAERTGNGCAPGQILADEGADDVLLEALLLVDYVIGNAEVFGDMACVIDVVERTATACLGRVGNTMLAGEAGLVPKLESEADYILPFLASIAATVEESTPPDMATAMVAGSVTGCACLRNDLLEPHRMSLYWCATSPQGRENQDIPNTSPADAGQTSNLRECA